MTQIPVDPETVAEEHDLMLGWQRVFDAAEAARRDGRDVRPLELVSRWSWHGRYVFGEGAR